MDNINKSELDALPDKEVRADCDQGVYRDVGFEVGQTASDELDAPPSQEVRAGRECLKMWVIGGWW